MSNPINAKIEKNKINDAIFNSFNSFFKTKGSIINESKIVKKVEEVQKLWVSKIWWARLLAELENIMKYIIIRPNEFRPITKLMQKIVLRPAMIKPSSYNDEEVPGVMEIIFK